jgi:hypothetical protein
MMSGGRLIVRWLEVLGCDSKGAGKRSDDLFGFVGFSGGGEGRAAGCGACSIELLGRRIGWAGGCTMVGWNCGTCGSDSDRARARSISMFSSAVM